MPNLTSQLILKLVDNVTGPAQKVTDALKKSGSHIKVIDNAFKGTGASARFQQQLAALGRSSADIDSVAKAMREYASAGGAAGNPANWTREQTAQIKRGKLKQFPPLRAFRHKRSCSKNSRQRSVQHNSVG
jgi:hypothetical protein